MARASYWTALASIAATTEFKNALIDVRERDDIDGETGSEWLFALTYQVALINLEMRESKSVFCRVDSDRPVATHITRNAISALLAIRKDLIGASFVKDRGSAVAMRRCHETSQRKSCSR